MIGTFRETFKVEKAALLKLVCTLVCTECVGSTRRWVTGVRADNTSLVLAYIPLVTIRIPHTFRTTSYKNKYIILSYIPLVTVRIPHTV